MVADVHLISLRKPFVGISVPGKLYGIMASARTVVASSATRTEVETFSAPPPGYRKCRPENARTSLKGPQRPRKTDRREPPKVYGP